jgi:enoyl-CoA hydratase
MSEVILERHGAVARITLNRPRALHALTLDMCLAMTEALLAWETDDAVRLVLLDHAGERGFCAGGDIRMLAASAADDGEAAAAFLKAEYRLDHLLFTYAKPVAAFMDGIVMGGGVGLSLPARYRIATERTLFAMPETGIGLFPDVGAGWYLPRLPGQVGRWLGLTGARIGPQDCRLLGLATHLAPSSELDDLKAALIAAPDDAERLFEPYAALVQDAPLVPHLQAIDRAFAGDTVEAIAQALRADPSPWAQEQVAVIDAKSPQSLKVTLRHLGEGAARADFADQMVADYRLAVRIVGTHDFQEGVRALILDKDNAPHWRPETLQGVEPSLLDDLFRPLPPAKAWTSIRTQRP